MSRPFKVQAVSHFSSQGARPTQEDFVLSEREKGIFVVADGFGGATPGLAAARTACESVRQYLIKEARDQDATMPFVLRSYFSLAGNVLFNAMIFANRKVMRLNREKAVYEKGGASVLAGFLDGDLLALANVGACGAYLFRDGKEIELVIPKSYSRLCNPLSRTTQEDHDSPLMALGMGDDLEPEICEYRLKPGDWLLLQTDGLGSTLRQEIASIQQRQFKGEKGSKMALKALNGFQYSDNASISLVFF
jgi:protein phosphatase